MSSAVDLVGQKFGRLTVISRAENKLVGKKKRPQWNCICSCGNEVVVVGQSLRNQSTRSCGCLHAEKSAERASKLTSRHGMASTPEYIVWQAMKGRCLRESSKDYPQYGGRGITVCDRWMQFDEFIADMGERPSSRHSLDRIDPNGNYEPKNCRWATITEQANNKRTNKRVVCDGESMTVAELSRKTGKPASTIYGRLAREGSY